jgi:hypothetical protein
MSGETATTTEPVTIASWQKFGRETLRVRLDMFKRRGIVDCRAWYQGCDGTLKPGRGGLAIGIRHLAQIVDAPERAVAMATASGLLDDPET